MFFLVMIYSGASKLYIEDLVDDDGNILRENQSKTFSYILKEKSQADDKPYITYDSTEYKVEVIVWWNILLCRRNKRKGIATYRLFFAVKCQNILKNTFG